MKKNLKIPLKNNSIMIWLFYFLFITPAFFLYHEPFDTLYPIIGYGRCAISLYYFLYCLIRRSYRIDSIYIWCFSFSTVLLLASLVGDLNFTSWINTTLQIIGCISFADYYRDRFNKIIKIGLSYFFLVVLVNNILMFQNPKYLFIVRNELGNQLYQFAASKNQFSMFTFPLLFFCNLAYEEKMINKVWFYIILIQAIIPPIVVLSVTSIVATIFFELIMVLKKYRIFRSKRVWINILIIVYIMQLVFTYVFRSDFFQYIVVDYLMKDPTLSGRSMIWDAAHKLILQHPILGMGNGKNGYYYYTVVDGYQYGNIMWAHNTSLDLLTQGGLMLYFAYFGIIITAYKYMFKGRKVISKDNMIYVTMLLMYGLMGYTERFDFRMEAYLVIGLAYFFSRYGKNLDNRKIS